MDRAVGKVDGAGSDVAGSGPGAGGGPFWRDRAWWRKTGHATFALWASMALGFVGTLVAARGLGPGPYGAVVLALSVASMVSAFLDLTLTDAVVYYGSQAVARDDMPGLRHLLRTALVADIVIGVVVTLAVVAAAGPLAVFSGGGPVDATLVRLAALSGLAVTADETTGAVLLLAGRPDLRAWTMAWSSLLRLGMVWGAVQVGGARLVLAAFALAALLGGITQGYVALRVGWRRWSAAAAGAPVRERSPDAAGLRQLMTFGIYSSIYTSAVAVRRAALSVILGRAAGPRTVGIVDVAMFPVSVASIAGAPIKLSLLPEQAALAARGNTAVLRRSIRWYTTIAIAVGVPGAVLGWFLLPWLIRTLYSPAFAAAVTPGRILLIAAVITLATGWAKIFPVAIGRPRLRTVITIVELAAAVLLMILLAGHGAVGAAIAVSAATAVGAAAWWVTAERWLDRADDAPASPAADDATGGPAPSRVAD